MTTTPVPIPKNVASDVFAQIVANPSKEVWLLLTKAGEWVIHVQSRRAAHLAQNAAIARGEAAYCFPGA